MNIVAIILAALKAIPILDHWYRESMKAYIKQKVESNDADFLKSLDDSRNNMRTSDLQRDIGKLLDSDD